MKTITNHTWKEILPETADKIKEWLEKQSNANPVKVNGQYEVWRFKYYDVTITYYSKGTLYVTDSDNSEIMDFHNFVNSLLPSKFIESEKEFYLGFDEAGKGELFGHLVLVGVFFPKDIANELKSQTSIANTKIKHTLDYWKDIFRKIDYFKSKGLTYQIEKIPPWQIDKYNINRLLDVTYQRIIMYLSRDKDLSKIRIVIDDYNIGDSLRNYLNNLKKTGAEIVVTTKADDYYIESHVASLIAKYEQQSVMDSIRKKFSINGIDIGSGNAGDPNTKKWLEEWKKSRKEWPWFIRKSYSTFRQLIGLNPVKKEELPPLNENILSREFKNYFKSGKLYITSLKINCPHCGVSSKLIYIIPKNGITTPICPNCREEIPDVSMTLRYYCGFILPDNSAISKGSLSKDLSEKKFFENYTFLINPTLDYESDQHPGSKKEMEKLGKFYSTGRINLMPISYNSDVAKMNSTEKDSTYIRDAKKYNAILLTNDGNMAGRAQAQGLFVIQLK